MHRISLTEFVVALVLLFALAQGAAKLYERCLTTLNAATAERIEGAAGRKE